MATLTADGNMEPRYPKSREQTMEALALANQVKRAREALTHRMYEMPPGESIRFAVELLEDLPDVLRSMTASAFLRRIRRREPMIGNRRAAPGTSGRQLHKTTARSLLAAGLQDDDRLGELTPAQMDRLVAVLRFVAGATRAEQ